MPEMRERPVQTTMNGTITYFSAGKKKVKLSASKMERYLEADSARLKFPKGLKVVFFDSLQGKRARLSAEQGVYHEAEKRMVVWDDVEFSNEKGEVLNTEKLIWSRDSGRIFTDAFVRIKRKDGVIHGNGLDAEQDLSSYTIREVTGEIHFERKNDNDTLTEAHVR